MFSFHALRRLFFKPHLGERTDIRDLLQRVTTLNAAGTRLGWPDEPTMVAVASCEEFVAALDAALQAFSIVRPKGDFLVDADVNCIHGELWVRFVKDVEPGHGNGKIETPLVNSFATLGDVMASLGGKMHYWGGNNYFDLSFPYDGPMREAFPEVGHLPWDAQYRQLFARATWDELRHKVFRFCDLAEKFAHRCSTSNKKSVLVPSVGVCVHPWMFADAGLSVTATDASQFALDVVAAPQNWPLVYSPAAKNRWDIAQSGSYATQGNPEGFQRIPDLTVPEIIKQLGARITFAC